MNSIENLVESHPNLFIKQSKEWFEIAIDWETTNKYSVHDAQKNEVAFIAERGGTLFTKLKRWFLRSHRPLEIDVFSKAGEVLLHLSRSFFWFFSDLDVVTPDGRKLGSIHRRFGILYKLYDLRDENGALFAKVRSPIWRLWTFPVLDHMGNQLAVITKRWGGALREVFTDADTYMVDFKTHPWTAAQRTVLFATAISIDFDFFENNSNDGGLFGLFD